MNVPMSYSLEDVWVFSPYWEKKTEEVKTMEINDVYPGGDYLKAADMAKPVIATIKDIKTMDFPSKDKNGNDVMRTKIVLTFDELDKSFVVNKTNANVIAELLGSTNTDSWAGQKIKLWKSKTKFGGQMVDCISVAPV